MGDCPDGSTLSAAIDALEATDPADWYGVNCAHPTHVLAGLDGAPWQNRLRFFRPNASTMSHEELDNMEVLDAGDLGLLVDSTKSLREQTPSSPSSADAVAPTAATSLRCGACPHLAEHSPPRPRIEHMFYSVAMGFVDRSESEFPEGRDPVKQPARHVWVKPSASTP